MWRILGWVFKIWLRLGRSRLTLPRIGLPRIALFCAMALPLASSLSVGCGTKNVAEPYEDKTDEEKAKAALDAKDYDTAIALYGSLVDGAPERYDYIPLLSSAYAGRAGIDFISLLKNTLSGSGSKDVLSQVAAFIPGTPTDAQLMDTQAAIARITGMPLSMREPTSTEAVAVSSNLQLVLYATAAAAMTLNQLAAKLDTGNFDANKLQSMSDAQVDTIVNSLTTAAAAGTAGTSEAAGKGAQEVLAKVQAMPGATTKEKLINYLQTQNQ